MCHNATKPNSISHKNSHRAKPWPSLRSSQRGYLIPLAAFIMAALSILAVSIMRTSSQVSLASAQELISTQAFYTAESGAQSAMNLLFSANGDRIAVDGNCIGMDYTLDFDALNIDGLGACQTRVTCGCRYEDNNLCNIATAGNYDGSNGLVYSFYTVTSAATCGSASVTSNRTVQVSAFTQ